MVHLLLESFCHKEHTHEIPITYHSKDMAKVKSFQKVCQTSRSRSQGQKFWYH
jgi:hypothetical protein